MECQSKELLQTNINQNKSQPRTSNRWIDSLIHKRIEYRRNDCKRQDS